MEKKILRIVINNIKTISWLLIVLLTCQRGFAQINQAPVTQQHPTELEMVFVQGGTFWMGCSSERDGCFDIEASLHSVMLINYYNWQVRNNTGAVEDVNEWQSKRI
jgi:formylglycine-generating enzyme required for sulfatase activity